MTCRTKRRLCIPPSLAQRRYARRRDAATDDGEDDPHERYPIAHCGPRHGLTPAQVWEAEQRLRRADRLRPIKDPLRWRLRLAGIISAIKQGRVGNAKWGRSMLARRGGLAMKCHAPHILQANREAIHRRLNVLKAWQREQQARRLTMPIEERLTQLAREARRPKTFMDW